MAGTRADGDTMQKLLPKLLDPSANNQRKIEICSCKRYERMPVSRGQLGFSFCFFFEDKQNKIYFFCLLLH